MTFTVEGNTVELRPGDCYFIPRGAKHGFINVQPENARILAVVTPALIGPEYFRELAEIVNAGGPPDMEKLKMVFKKHGLVPVMS